MKVPPKRENSFYPEDGGSIRLRNMSEIPEDNNVRSGRRVDLRSDATNKCRTQNSSKIERPVLMAVLQVQILTITINRITPFSSAV